MTFIKPYISVIVILYNRNQYIEEALNSLENQDLNKELYEVILVANLNLNINKTFLMNLKIINSSIKSGWGKYLQGLDNASGEVISFLEDDDLFDKSKLSYLYEYFRKYNKLIYYKNNTLNFIDSNKIISNNYPKSTIKIFKNTKLLNYKKIIRMNHDYKLGFNTSSITIKKILLEKYRNYLPQDDNVLLALDVYLFYLVLEDGSDIIYDSRYLTFKRLHNLNTSVKTAFYSYISGNYLHLNSTKGNFKNIELQKVMQREILLDKSILYLNGQITLSQQNIRALFNNIFTPYFSLYFLELFIRCFSKYYLPKSFKYIERIYKKIYPIIKTIIF